jgi:hypothetical protein
MTKYDEDRCVENIVDGRRKNEVWEEKVKKKQKRQWCGINLPP